MDKILFSILSLVLIVSCRQADDSFYELSAEEYFNKMKGAWIGQMAGVGWGLPTEFDWIDSVIPMDKVPRWENAMINQQGNDDLYVELTFMESMGKYGLDVSQRQAAIDFANSGYSLWAANRRGRENLREGIAPPESGHPHFNKNCDDIDYQIEADYSGIIAPGMPNVAISLGEKFGRIMNFGDGLYGGQFIGGMYAAAYFSNNIAEIIESGLKCIPSESLYAEVIRDVLRWFGEYPDTWETSWNLIMKKYYRTHDNQPFQEANKEAWVGIDAKINGAFVVMGLLYGKGNMDSTIIYSMRCGLDSDCNPSNAAGILGTIIGFDQLDEKFKSGIDYGKKFAYTQYDLNDLFERSEQFAGEFIIRNGGRTVTDKNNKKCYLIKKVNARPSAFRPSYAPGTYDENSRFTKEEFAQIKAWSRQDFVALMKELGLNAELTFAGKEVKPELIEWNGKTQVLTTTPMSHERGLIIEFKNNVAMEHPAEVYMSFKAGHAGGESWQLIVNRQFETIIGEENSTNGWVEIKVPVTKGRSECRIEARNLRGNAAINYWADFHLDYR